MQLKNEMHIFRHSICSQAEDTAEEFVETKEMEPISLLKRYWPVLQAAMSMTTTNRTTKTRSKVLRLKAAMSGPTRLETSHWQSVMSAELTDVFRVS